MSLFVITGVRFDSRGEVERVMWASVDGSVPRFNEEPYEVPVDQVVEALDRGDVVEMLFQEVTGYVPGGAVEPKVLSGGFETIQEKVPTAGRMLTDLPLF